MKPVPPTVPTRTVGLDARNGWVVLDVPTSWIVGDEDAPADGFPAGAHRCRPALDGGVPFDVVDFIDAKLHEKRLVRTGDWRREGPAGYWIADVDRIAKVYRPRKRTSSSPIPLTSP